MKKLITIFCFILIALWTVPVYGQASQQRIVRIRGASPNIANIVAVRGLTLTYPNTTLGLHTNTSNYFYTGALWRVVTGNQLNADGVAETTWGVDGRSFLYGYDDVAANWNRLDVHAWSDAMVATQDGLDVISYTTFFDTGNVVARRWLGDELSSDAVVTTTIAPYVGGFGHIYQTDDTTWARDSGETADGGDIGAGANGAYRLTLNYGWNGATWSVMNLGAVGELQVTDVSTRAGEDVGNDWQKNRKQSIETYQPAEEGPTAVDDAAGGDVGDEVLAPKEILGYPNVCIWLKNEGGGSGDALAAAAVLVSPSNAAGEWVNLTWTTCDTLASGDVCVYCVTGNAYRYIKAEALCGAGDDTTITAWITGNVD